MDTFTLLDAHAIFSWAEKFIGAWLAAGVLFAVIILVPKLMSRRYGR